MAVPPSTFPLISIDLDNSCTNILSANHDLPRFGSNAALAFTALFSIKNKLSHSKSFAASSNMDILLIECWHNKDN